MRKLSVLFGILSVVALVAACGPDGGNNGGGGITAEEFAQQFSQSYAEAACKSAYQCPEGQNPVFMALLFGQTTSQQECVDALSGNTDEIVPSEDLESGTIEYDPQAAADCLAAIEQRSSGNACDIAIGATPVPSSCLQAGGGTLADGETCATDGQCQSGACDSSAIPDSCTGECAPRAEAGEACGDPNTQEGPTCRSTLACVPDGSGGFVCAQQGSLEEGDPCVLSFSSLAACGGGLICNGDQGNATCKPGTVVEEGGDCSGDLVYCTAGTACLDGTCSPPGGPGDTCMNSSLACGHGTYCDFDAEQCKATKEAGATCEEDSECEGDLECPNGTCEQPEACTLPMN